MAALGGGGPRLRAGVGQHGRPGAAPPRASSPEAAALGPRRGAWPTSSCAGRASPTLALRRGGVAVAQDLSFEESVAAYKKALGLNPSLVEAWINVGQVYYNNFRKKEGYMDQALHAFQKALDVDPQSSSALYSLVRMSYTSRPHSKELCISASTLSCILNPC